MGGVGVGVGVAFEESDKNDSKKIEKNKKIIFFWKFF